MPPADITLALWAASIAGAHDYGRNVGRYYQYPGTRVLEVGPSPSSLFLLPRFLPIMLAAHYQHLTVQTAAQSTTALAFAA